MPTYTYACDCCGLQVDKILKISERTEKLDTYCGYCAEDTPHTFNIGAPQISYIGVNNVAKVPTVMKDRLNQIKKHYPAMRSTV